MGCPAERRSSLLQRRPVHEDARPGQRHWRRVSRIHISSTFHAEHHFKDNSTGLTGLTAVLNGACAIETIRSKMISLPSHCALDRHPITKDACGAKHDHDPPCSHGRGRYISCPVAYRDPPWLLYENNKYLLPLYNIS